MSRVIARRRSWCALAKRAKLSLALESLEPRLNLALNVPALSSLPGANQTIYLDFDGHTTTGTSWNSSYGVDPIISPAYDTDGNPSNFSQGELDTIQKVWQRVAEDYAPFQVNVTTVPPPVEDLMKSGAGDTKWGVRVVISKDTAFNCGCGGKAYVDSFSWDSDTPVFVFNTSQVGVAEAASHEVGHSLGLSHDGTSTSAYYYGHGTGTTSWAPIMGVGYNVNVTQFDDGEYYDSNNGGPNANYGKGPDDLKIIATYNGFGYRADEAGDSIYAAAPLSVSKSSINTTGIISSRTDVDVYNFTTGDGAVSINISPAALGANLDIKADLLDSSGQVIATSNPTDGLDASFSLTLAAGEYYLRIDGTGVGDPTVKNPTGYTDYGSIGQYSITGSIVGVDGDTLDVSSSSTSQYEGNSGPNTYTYTITRSGDTSGTTTVDYVVTGSSTSQATADDFVNAIFPGGTLTFDPGVTSLTVSVDVQGDTLVESDEGFTLSLMNPSNKTSIGKGHVDDTILNDDTPPVTPTLNISATDATKSEGSGGGTTPFVFTISRGGDTSFAASVSYSVTVPKKNGASASDFNGGVLPTNVVVNFDKKEVSKDITIYVNADNTKETNESFTVKLSNPVGEVIGSGSANGNILNDDAGKGGPKAKKEAIPKLIAVADPLWMFVPPQYLSAPQLSVPVITTIDNVSIVGDLDEVAGQLDLSVPQVGTIGLASLTTPTVLATGDRLSVASGELPTSGRTLGGITSAAARSALSDAAQVPLAALGDGLDDSLAADIATGRRQNTDELASELAADQVLATW